MIEVEIEDDGWSRLLPEATALAAATAQAALTAAGAEGDVVILLADDAAVRDLNARFRGQDKATNVLSFPALADGAFAEPGRRPLGDIVLAREVCVREAAEQGKRLVHHVQHLVAHGVLHLVGFDHESEAEALAMEALERRILANLGAPDPYFERPVAALGGDEPDDD